MTILRSTCLILRIDGGGCHFIDQFCEDAAVYSSCEPFSMLLTRHRDENAALVSLIEPLATQTGFVSTLLPEVRVVSACRVVARMPQIYEPSLMVIAQGSKLAYLGYAHLEYGAGHYLVQALAVPFECGNLRFGRNAIAGCCYQHRPSGTGRVGTGHGPGP